MKLEVINTERAARGQSKASVAYYFDHHATESDTNVSVIEEDFMSAMRELVPSVSLDELLHYEQVRDMFEGAAKKPASNGDANRPLAARSASSRNQLSRAQLAATMKRAPSGKNGVSNVNGSHGSAHQVTRRKSDSEDDYVVRTDRLTMNGSTKGKGKGKGADVRVPNEPTEADGAAEDLYD